MKAHTFAMFVAGLGLFTSGCTSVLPTPATAESAAENLVGSWRGKIQFTTGSFAAVKDLEFMYVFNAGGTMTESSNYDASPPVPPAYGVWRKVGPRQYEAKYAFFSTTAPADFDAIAKGGGWSPGGHGVLVEKITLAEDGKSFDSSITYDGYDHAGKITETGSKAEAHVVRMTF